MTTKLRRTAALIAVPVALTLSLTACGGGGRPSSDDIAKAMQKSSSVTADQANCFGKALHDSKLSDDKLKELMKADNDSDLKDFSDSDKQAVVQAFQSAATCMGVDPSSVPTDFSDL